MGSLFRLAVTIAVIDHYIKTLDGDDLEKRVEHNIYNKSLLQIGFATARNAVQSVGTIVGCAVNKGVKFAEAKVSK